MTTELFLEIFEKANNKYAKQQKRLAGEAWKEPWQTLIATIFSAQTKDEVTIPVAEKLFRKYSLKELANANEQDVLEIIKSLNYNKTKAKNAVKAASYLVKEHNGKVPETIEELVKIPGVGRKTANLILGEVYNQQAICVDTHVHKISNMLNIVHTKTAEETEYALMKIAPKPYWNKINRIFVLWGKDLVRYDKDKLLNSLK